MASRPHLRKSIRPRSLPHLLVLGLLLTAGGSCKHGSAPQRPVAPVSVVETDFTAGADGADFSAGIVSCTQVDAAFKSGGYVVSLLQVLEAGGVTRNVQAGDAVKQGDALAQVRTQDYKDSLAQAQAALAEALASEQKARRDYVRSKNLYASQSITAPDFDASKAAYDSASAQRESAQAQVASARTALDDATLKSPLSGVVVQKNVEVGTLAGEGTVGFVVADTRCVKAVFGVPAFMLEDIKVGAPVTVTVADALGRQKQFPGTITEISPSADTTSRVFDVEVTVHNPDDRIRLGMIASLAIATAAKPTPVALIPLGAVVRPPGHSSAYGVYVVANAAGQSVANLKEVQLGDVVGNRIAVTGGLSSGDRVIVQGATMVQNGERVRVISQSTADTQ